MLALGCSNDHNMLGNVAFTVIPRGVLVWYLPQNPLGNCDVVTFVRHYGAGWMQTMENAKMHRCYYNCSLSSWKYSQSHKQEQRAFKQRGRERQRERYKTIDLIAEYNHLVFTSCGNATTWLIGRRRTKEMLAYVGQKVWLVSNWTPDWTHLCQHNATYSPTWCRNEHNLHVVLKMLAQHVAFVCTGLNEICGRKCLLKF